METRSVKATNTSFKFLLSKAKPKNLNLETDKLFKGADLVLADRNALLYFRLFQLGQKPHHRKCHKKTM